MNKIELLGRITNDIELKNNQVAKFSIAVNRKFIKQGEERQTDFFEITAFGKTAEFISKYFSKGQQVAMIGRLQNNNYEDNQGNKHYSNVIIAEEVYFADSKKENSNTKDIIHQEFTIDSKDELPF